MLIYLYSDFECVDFVSLVEQISILFMKKKKKTTTTRWADICIMYMLIKTYCSLGAAKQRMCYYEYFKADIHSSNSTGIGDAEKWLIIIMYFKK